MILAIESSATPAIAFLALVSFGASVEFFTGRAWRSRRQRIASTATYLSLLPLFLISASVGLGPVKSLLCCVAFYQGLKWMLVSTETRQATIIGTCGLSLLMRTDDGATVETSLLQERRSFGRGEIVWVHLDSSYFFGWRLRAKIA